MADAFQPGGRAPAPAPPDLVQDFVNTEIPDWNRDDVATPAALGAWLAGHGLSRPGDVVDADLFVAARALRSALRELALANTLGQPLAPERRAEVDRALERPPPRARRSGGVGLAPAGEGAARGLGAIVAVVAGARAGGDWERLKACWQETCGWLFYDGPGTLVELELDAGVRQPREVARLPAAPVGDRGLMRSAAYVVSLGLRRLRRRDGGALAAA